MSSVTVVMSADDARLLAAHERLFAQQQKALDNYAKTVAKSKESQAQAEADAASRKAATVAEKERLAIMEKGQKLIDNQRTAQEKFNDSKAEAKRLYDAEAISAADLAKRIDVLNRELRESTGETDKHNAAMKRGQEVIKANLTPLEKYAGKIVELKRLLKDGAIDATTFARAQKDAAKELDEVSSFGNLATSITGLATAYISVNSVLAISNGLLDEQNQLQQTALTKTKELASAQSDAVKNLIGLNFAESGAMLKEAEAIAQRTGFADRGKLTLALGEAISAGATPEQATSAVEVSARLNKQTPDQLGSISGGAVDVARLTGINDAEKNIGFLLDIAAESLVKNVDKMQDAFIKALPTSIAVMPGIDQAEAAKQSGSLWAALNKASGDKRGDSTSTAQVQSEVYLAKFFDHAGLKDKQDQIKELEAKKAITGHEEFRIRTAEEKLAKASGKDKEKAQDHLNHVKATATLDALDEEKLAKLKIEQEQYANIKDPGDTRSRILAIREADAKTRERFFENMPGEATFKKPIEAILTKGTDAATLFDENYKSKIDFDPQTTRNAEKRVKTSTPQLSLADATASSQSNLTGAELRPDMAAIGAIKQLRDETLPKVRPASVFTSALQWIEENVTPRIPLIAPRYDTVESAAKNTRELLVGSRRSLEGDLSPVADASRELIDKQLEALKDIVKAVQNNPASKAMENAANKIGDAADRLGQPQSIATAARAQAGTANQ